MPSITISHYAADTVLDAFGWTIRRKDGAVVYKDTGEPVKTFNGHEIRVDELGGVVDHKETGEAVPLRDNFADITEWRKYNNERDK